MGRIVAFRITDECIECKACLGACSYQAVVHVPAVDVHPQYRINASACTHCWPFVPAPRCVDVCPVGCIVLDTEHPGPAVSVIREELGKVVAVAGLRDAGRMIARLRQWVRKWIGSLPGGAQGRGAADQLLDFYNWLALLESEFAPDGAGKDSGETQES